MSKDVPVSLEGNAARSRFDPTYLVRNGSEEREIATRWNTASVTVGPGWGFKLMPEQPLRPIFNYTRGHVSSDLALMADFINDKAGTDIDFLQDGKMSAYALGFKRLFSLGFGRELDTSATGLPLTRHARLVARHVFGEGASGGSLGMAISF